MMLDLFAAAALAGMCANPKVRAQDDSEIAGAAYSLAEAMLEERDRDPDDEDEDDEDYDED